MFASGSAPPAIIEREVTASVGEFERGLRLAFPQAIEGGPLHFSVRRHGCVMEVDVSALPPRAIGRLALPVLAVTLRFPSADAPERAAMLAWLDFAMHRGGG
jgi:hypothetical protein